MYSILCIVIRLGAVLLAVNALASAISLPMLTRPETADPGYLWLSAVAIVLTVVLAFLLWLYPGWLARLCTGRSAQQVFESPIGSAELQWIALSVLGVYLVVEGIASVGRYAIQEVITNALLDVPQRLRLFSRMVFPLLQIVLGAALAFGARGLTGLLNRLRDAGYPHQPESFDNTRD
jgi:hypothetical protein